MNLTPFNLPTSLKRASTFAMRPRLPSRAAGECERLTRRFARWRESRWCS